MFERRPRISHALMRLQFESVQQHLFAVGHARTLAFTSPLNEPLEYTNSEDSQEEEGQEGSENGDEFAGTM